MSDEQQQPPQPDNEPQTPGQILKAARDFRGYQRANVAERLRLSEQTIIDIENDDYTHFTAEIYLRGHMRSYARLCDIDPAIVLEAYEALDVKIGSDPQVPVVLAQEVPVPISRRTRPTKRKTLLWAGIGILLVLIVMVMLWWQEQQRHLYYSQKVKLPVETKAIDQAKPASTDGKMTAPPKPAKKTPRSAAVHSVGQKNAKKKQPKHLVTSHHKKNNDYVPDYTITPVK